MTVTRERFEQGMSYADYKAQMTRNRERLEETEQSVVLDPEVVAAFKAKGTLNVLALAEDWCGDVIANLPILARLAEESGSLDLRVFLRDQNSDLMDQYLKDGVHKSIPVFAFFDEEFNEIGHWIERPASMTERQQAMIRDLYATDPLFEGIAPDTSSALLPDATRDRLWQAYGDFRTQNRAASDREVQRELAALIEGEA